MKTLKKIIIGLAAALSLAVVNSHAAGGFQFFGGTNWISATNPVILSWPTNSSGTNTTGGPIEIRNQEHLVFDVSGFLTNNTNTSVLYVWLTTSIAGNTPQWNTNTTLFTNAGGTVYSLYGQNDWSSNLFLVPIALPVSTGFWRYETNIVMDITTGMPNANYVGIYGISNALGFGNSLFNPNGCFSLNKKLIPTPLIGQ